MTSPNSFFRKGTNVGPCVVSTRENVRHDKRAKQLEVELKRSIADAARRCGKFDSPNPAWASEQLQKSQRAWATYRDETCALGAFWSGPLSFAWPTIIRMQSTEDALHSLKDQLGGETVLNCAVASVALASLGIDAYIDQA